MSLTVNAVLYLTLVTIIVSASSVGIGDGAYASGWVTNEPDYNQDLSGYSEGQYGVPQSHIVTYGLGWTGRSGYGTGSLQSDGAYGLGWTARSGGLRGTLVPEYHLQYKPVWTANALTQAVYNSAQQSANLHNGESTYRNYGYDGLGSYTRYGDAWQN